jgi:hypothetical protein
MNDSDTSDSADAPSAPADQPVVDQPVTSLRALIERLSHLPPSPRSLRLLVMVGAIVILFALMPTLLNSSHNPAGAERARATATPRPSTAAPSPTSMPGYQPLVDNADGFVIQYPLAWACAPSNPGVDCIDSPDAQNYRLQVQLPGRWTGANTGADPNDASVWVDYALGAFSDVPGRTYERAPGPAQAATFGGATWQSGAAIITIGMDQDNPPGQPNGQQVRIRVQVYATVHTSQPYIIALYAADDHFSAGSSLYFQPMLKSFAFLSNGAGL